MKKAGSVQSQLLLHRAAFVLMDTGLCKTKTKGECYIIGVFFLPGGPSSSSLLFICNFQLNRSPQYSTSVGINRYLNWVHRRHWPNSAARCSDPGGCGYPPQYRTLVPSDNMGSMCSIGKQHQITFETLLAILQVLEGYEASSERKIGRILS